MLDALLPAAETFQAVVGAGRTNADAIRAAAEAAAAGEEASVTGFLERVSLVSDIDTMKEGEEGGGRVVLMTVHGAKGLEFDLVVLIDPEWFGTGIEGAVDRYVAMTRATQQLVILTSS